MSAPDLIIIPCRACGSEGRIYHGDGSQPWHWSEPCDDCDGTGGEMIEGEPLTLDDMACWGEGTREVESEDQ